MYKICYNSGSLALNPTTCSSNPLHPLWSSRRYKVQRRHTLLVEDSHNLNMSLEECTEINNVPESANLCTGEVEYASYVRKPFVFSSTWIVADGTPRVTMSQLGLPSSLSLCLVDLHVSFLYYRSTKKVCLMPSDEQSSTCFKLCGVGSGMLFTP